MNKKGQIFTVIAILLIMLMFASFELFSYIHQQRSIQTRVATMNSLLNSIEDNMERQMYISGFRIIFLAQNEITSTGLYVNNVSAFFEEAFFNGTVNGVPNSTILSGATYDDIANSLNEKAQKVNVEIILDNSTIFVTQDDPWNVKFTLSSDFIVQDISGLAKWEKKQNISTFIAITNFQDPLYIVETRAEVGRRINQTIYEGNYVEGTDYSNLTKHINGGNSMGYYAAHDDAPSFLKRLEGDFSADENGIESLVRVSSLPSDLHKVKACVDYIYFDDSNDPNYEQVSQVASWFYIDNEDNNHTNKYQIP